MKVFGIILEANPFHYGHQYLINEIKKEYKPDLLIAITSTSFTMRGEISLLDKFTKTNLLLENGIDIVLELPFILGVQSADYFAKNCVDILNLLKITDLAFGSETTNINLYYQFYDFISQQQIDTNDFKAYSKKQQINALLHSSNFSKEDISIINMPNFTLGFQYIKSIMDSNYPIHYHIIQRLYNNYDDTIPKGKIASATSLRTLLKNNEDITNYLPYHKNNIIDLNKAELKLFTLLEYQYIVNDKIPSTYFGLKEGIHNYIKNNGDFSNTLQTLQNSIKNKKYTISLLNRCMLHSLLNTDELKYNHYIRILGINHQGIAYLNTLPKNCKTFIFASPKEIKNKNLFDTSIQKILHYELKATKLYQIISSKKDLYQNEFKLPIRKEK